MYPGAFSVELLPQYLYLSLDLELIIQSECSTVLLPLLTSVCCQYSALPLALAIFA
jgi:hypothetical protein